MSHDRLSVLVVDDDRDAAGALAARCNTVGYDARVACSWAAVRRSIAEEWPDVVVLDPSMRGLDGRELARLLDPGPRGMRPLLIAVTGIDGKSERRWAGEIGTDLCLVEPVGFDVLAGVLRRFWRVVGPVAVG
jgi:DNA-binding response OmpR family regulator